MRLDLSPEWYEGALAAEGIVLGGECQQKGEGKMSKPGKLVAVLGQCPKCGGTRPTCCRCPERMEPTHWEAGGQVVDASPLLGIIQAQAQETTRLQKRLTTIMHNSAANGGNCDECAVSARLAAWTLTIDPGGDRR